MGKLEILTEAKERAKSYRFGDQLTNICAGENNPLKYCLYVSHNKNTVKCTNGKGRFWDTAIEVVYKGIILQPECERLFKPVWESKYGTKDGA